MSESLSLTQLLKVVMLSKKVSKYALAKKTGISHGYITMICNGEKKNPSTDILIKIADVLELSHQQILKSVGLDLPEARVEAPFKSQKMPILSWEATNLLLELQDPTLPGIIDGWRYTDCDGDKIFGVILESPAASFPNGTLLTVDMRASFINGDWAIMYTKQDKKARLIEVFSLEKEWFFIDLQAPSKNLIKGSTDFKETVIGVVLEATQIQKLKK